MSATFDGVSGPSCICWIAKVVDAADEHSCWDCDLVEGNDWWMGGGAIVSLVLLLGWPDETSEGVVSAALTIVHKTLQRSSGWEMTHVYLESVSVIE